MPQPEYNLYCDRIASEIVFRSGVPITGVGLDVTTRCKLKAEDIERLKTAGHPTSTFLVRLIGLWRELPRTGIRPCMIRSPWEWQCSPRWWRPGLGAYRSKLRARCSMG